MRYSLVLDQRLLLLDFLQLGFSSGVRWLAPPGILEFWMGPPKDPPEIYTTWELHFAPAGGKFAMWLYAFHHQGLHGEEDTFRVQLWQWVPFGDSWLTSYREDFRSPGTKIDSDWERQEFVPEPKLLPDWFPPPPWESQGEPGFLPGWQARAWHAFVSQSLARGSNLFTEDVFGLSLPGKGMELWLGFQSSWGSSGGEPFAIVHGFDQEGEIVKGEWPRWSPRPESFLSE